MLNMVAIPTITYHIGGSDTLADALKGIGHACGHNLIAIMSLAGALATAKTMEQSGIGGKVMLFGTPAEGQCIVNVCHHSNAT
jgi:metal-dependent amidase/aminoacylase/carboxypeptidase family protein